MEASHPFTKVWFCMCKLSLIFSSFIERPLSKTSKWSHLIRCPRFVVWSATAEYEVDDDNAAKCSSFLFRKRRVVMPIYAASQSQHVALYTIFDESEADG